MALGSTQPLSGMITKNIFWWVKAAGAWGWQPYHLYMPIVMKSGNLNHLEPLGPVQGRTGIALPYIYDFNEYSKFVSPLFLGEFSCYRRKFAWNGNAKTNKQCIFRCSKVVFHRLTFFIIIVIFLRGLGRLNCSGIDAFPSFPRACTISSSSRLVFKGVFRESGVVHSFKMVDPVFVCGITLIEINSLWDLSAFSRTFQRLYSSLNPQVHISSFILFKYDWKLLPGTWYNPSFNKFLTFFILYYDQKMLTFYRCIVNCGVYILFTHQQMHFLLNLEKFKIYIKIHIIIAPTCFCLRPSSGSLYRDWLKLYLC